MSQLPIPDRWVYADFASYLKTDRSKRDALHLLDQEEHTVIRKARMRANIWAAIVGVLGVIALCLPPYFWPHWFGNYPVNVPLIQMTYEAPIIITIYGLVLTVIEIVILTWINIRAVRTIAAICDFPDFKQDDYKEQIMELVNVGLEKQAKKLQKFGINPYEGMSRFSIFFIFVWNRIRAYLSNIVFKMIVRKILGRFALKIVMELASAPVNAFWNAWASSRVTNEARLRIIAAYPIREFVKKCQTKFGQHTGFQELIYANLQYIAMSKRRYHYNHFLMASTFISKFKLDPKKVYKWDDDYWNKVRALDDEAREWVVRMLTLGMMVDGSISWREELIWAEIEEEQLTTISWKEVEIWEQTFVKGKGIKSLLEEETLEKPKKDT